ncbi:MAG: glycosyltransferase family 39 protein [Caldilineaceae bacterium]|nr:glycosyltransferase family 39 protein [Caldilineaceae bacterium]
MAIFPAVKKILPTQRLLVLSVTLAGFGWRVQGLGNQSLWRDEVDAVYFALRNLSETLLMAVQPGQNGVLYFLMLRPWLRMVGSSEFALRFPSVLFGALAIPLIWQVTRRLIPGQKLPPITAALFLMLNPYHLWYSQEGKMYAIITALALLAAWCWLQGMEKGGWRPWTGYWITVTLAMYTHLLMILIIPLHLFWFVIAWPRSKRHWRGYGLALAGLTLPYLPMVVWQWDMLVQPVQQTGFSFTPLTTMLERLLEGFTRGFAPVEEGLWLAPIYFLGLAGLLFGWLEMEQGEEDDPARLGPIRRYLLIVVWLLAPIAFIYAMSLREPIFTARYLIWILPAAVMLMALGLQLVWKNGGLLRRPLTILLLLYVVGFWGAMGLRQKDETLKYDLRGAVTSVAGQRDPADELLILQIPYMEYAYRYYSSDQGPDPFAGSDARLGWWAKGLWTNYDAPDEEKRVAADAEMRRITAGAGTIWVLSSEVEMWDQRHLMNEWLEQNADMTEQQAFHGAEVRRYELK